MFEAWALTVQLLGGVMVGGIAVRLVFFAMRRWLA